VKKTKPLASLLVVALIGFLSTGFAGFHSLKESLVEVKKQDITTVLNMARNQSSSYINQHKQGLLTKQEADKKIIEFLSGMQHEAAYIWANDNHGIARVHAREEITGQFQTSYIKHMAQLHDDNIVYYPVTNIKPVSNHRVLKINGFTKIPEWDWVIGFGVYMDDIEKVALKSMVPFIISGAISILILISTAFYWLNKSPE
jgi:methyl-accepting chemotaxis protein